MHTFFIVATPIGNLEDVGMRALRVLGGCPVIVCERPGHTLKLLNHFGISGKKLVAYTEANKKRAVGEICGLLRAGDCAFVVDAGTPAVSDPGPELVAAVREKGFAIQMIPGPSALTAAIALSGERVNDFRFVGFFPYKLKERRGMLDALGHSGQYLIAYEAPHRMRKTLEFLQQAYPDCRVVLASEISKVHEKLLKGTPQELLGAFALDTKLAKGEFVMLVCNPEHR